MIEVELESSIGSAASRAGVVDRAFGWLESRPGTPVPWIFLGAVILGVAGHVVTWLSGETPIGEPRLELLFPLGFLIVFVTLIVAFDAVAHSAFDDFRVTLEEPAATVARMRAELTSIPDLPAAIAVVVSVLINNAGTGDTSGLAAEPPLTGIVLVAFWTITISALGLLLLHTLRQLREVRRLLARVAKVDLLAPAPINAFSRLTAATAGGILAIGVLFAVVDSGDPSASGVGIDLLFALLAAAFFVLPLRGMHGRLSAEKGKLLGEANTRLQATIASIHRMVDAGDLGPADDLQKTQTALLAERDLYLRLSTWPWNTSTFRAILSAVMLPIFIGLVLRIFTKFI